MPAVRHPVRAALLTLGLLALGLVPGLGSAATSSIVVGATVPSATSLNTAGCASGTANVTDFGIVQAGSSTVTSADCVVTFGSSNDTARLRVQQTDRLGDAMFQQLGRGGALDPVFAGTVGMFAAAGLSVADASSSVSSGGIARQSDGRLLVTGENGANVEVRRYLPDGTADGSFTTISISVCASGHDVAGIVVSADDSFIIGGDSGCGGIGAWAARFSANGTRDMSYGGDGLANSGFSIEIRDLDVHTDGSVVLGGGTPALVRLDPDGSNDLDFSGDGHVALVGPPGDSAVCGVAFHPDGSIIAAGYTSPGGGYETYVARVLPDGSYHGTFGGGDGWEPTNLAPVLEGRSLVLAPDGSIFVAAYQGVVKYTPGGLVDTTFGANGVAWVNTVDPSVALNDAILQLDGSIVAFGQHAGSEVVVVRITPGGVLDATFGTNGIQRHDPVGAGNGANRAVWAEDGDLVTFGAGDSGASIVRLDGRTITDYDNGAANWTTPGTNAFGACLAGTSAGASSLWTTDGACTAVDGLDWNEVTPAPSAIARTTVAATQGATVNLRFGLRTTTSQAPGRYVAPVTFSVVAPEA